MSGINLPPPIYTPLSPEEYTVFDFIINPSAFDMQGLQEQRYFSQPTAAGVSSPPATFTFPHNTVTYRPPSEIGSSASAISDSRRNMVMQVIEEYLKRDDSVPLHNLLTQPDAGITMNSVKFRITYPNQRSLLAFIQALSAYSLYSSKQFKWKRLSAVDQSDTQFVASLVEQSVVRVLRMHGQTSTLPENISTNFASVVHWTTWDLLTDVYKFKEWARDHIQRQFGFRNGETNLNVLRYEVATQRNYFISHPYASVSLFKNWFCLRPSSVGWQIEKMRIQYGSALDPKEPGEFDIHSFTDNNPDQAWRLTQMIVLHIVSEFNKGEWAKRGFSRWNEDFYADYYKYGSTPEVVAEIFRGLGQWWQTVKLTHNFFAETDAEGDLTDDI